MKKIVVLCLTIMLYKLGFSQSETHNFVTYDTTINYVNASNNGQSGGSAHWLIRVTRPVNYFTANNADTASRPILMTMPGAGEIQTGNFTTDTNNISAYGPHYWLKNGWDGGLQLGNGKHYPILITVEQATANTRPWFTLALLRTLKSVFHPRGGVFHVGGLSQGSYEWGCLIGYSNNTTGDHEAMTLIKSWVDLEGVGPETFQNSGSPIDATMPQSFGIWSHLYGGKFFGLEGIADTRNVWQISQPMNDSSANSGYFSWQKATCPGSPTPGAHGCWNVMYDPSQTDWRNNPIVSNTILTTGSPANTIGDYIYDAINGNNIFQWMLRQGDTTLVAASCNPIVTAGNNQTITLPTNSVSTTGTATYQCSHTQSSLLWTQVSGPNTATITASTSLTTSFTGLIAGTYIFQLTATDNTALSGNAQITITVNSATPPTVSGGGPYTVTLPTTSVTLNGTASGNGGTTISSVAWTYISGPAGSSIASPSSNSTVVNGLVQGTYVFRFTATDNNGNSNHSDATVNVNSTLPAGTNQLVHIGEYVVPWIDSAGHARTITSNINLMGTGGVGTSGLPGIINTPGYTFNRLDNLLHGSIFLAVQDSSTWTAGNNDQGQAGQKTFSSNILSLTKIPSDSAGNPVTGITLVQGFYVNNTSEGFFAVKHGAVTDTILGTGDLKYGMAMDGTAGATTSALHPLYYRTGHHIIEMAASKAYAILFDDGTIWTGAAVGNFNYLGYAGTGSQYLSPHQVTGFDDSIRHVVGGDVGGFICLSKTGKLWGFGPHSGYLGNASDVAYTTPHDLTTDISNYILNGTTRTSITMISANSDAFHALANDSTQWSWGDNGQGAIGNGVEANLVSPPGSSTPYSIDPAQILVLPQTHPVQVTNKHNFIKIFSGCLFGFIHYSLDATGQLYSNGRNKGGVAGNGVVECVGANGDMAAAYANSWDVPYCTPISPYNLSSNIPQSCPGCKTGVVTTFCSECTIPTTTPTANAGSNQSISTATTSLDGTGSTCTGGKLVYYTWTQLSGPNSSVIDAVAAPKPNISGMIAGTYTFQLQVKDNGFNTSTSNVTVTVSSGPPPSCTNCILRKRAAKLRFLP